MLKWRALLHDRLQKKIGIPTPEVLTLPTKATYVSNVSTVQEQMDEKNANVRSLIDSCDGTRAYRLSDLFKMSPLHRVNSRVLGCVVLFACDEAEIPPDNKLPVYRASELCQMLGKSPEEIKAIHAVKVEFGRW